MRLHGNRYVFGIVNCAFFNRRPEGDRTYFATRAERDADLERLRANAIERGLSRSAAAAGIYPMRVRARDLPASVREMMELDLCSNYAKAVS